MAPAAGSFVRPTEEVPRGHCWLAADDGGRDAAAAPPPVHVVAVPAALLTGRVVRVLWPPGRAGKVEGGGGEGRDPRVVRTATYMGR